MLDECLVQGHAFYWRLQEDYFGKKEGRKFPPKGREAHVSQAEDGNQVLSQYTIILTKSLQRTTMGLQFSGDPTYR